MMPSYTTFTKHAHILGRLSIGCFFCLEGASPSQYWSIWKVRITCVGLVHAATVVSDGGKTVALEPRFRRFLSHALQAGPYVVTTSASFGLLPNVSYSSCVSVVVHRHIYVTRKTRLFIAGIKGYVMYMATRPDHPATPSLKNTSPCRYTPAVLLTM